MLLLMSFPKESCGLSVSLSHVTRQTGRPILEILLELTAFVFLQLSAGVSDNTMLTFLINLRKNGSKAPWLFVVTEAGIDDESIGPVSSGVIDDRLGAKVCLEF